MIFLTLDETFTFQLFQHTSLAGILWWTCCHCQFTSIAKEI